MDNNQPNPYSDSEEDNTSPSPRMQIAGLVSDVRELAEAEWEYARARLSYSGGIMRKAGLFALLAVLAISAAAIALVLGILMILASYLGPWIATAITVIIFTLAAYLLALKARSTAKNLSFSDSDNG
jgi:hypothetical protein